jgi:putative membrane protein
MKEKYIQLYLKGLLMGAADIVPGVSGGTMALITGIYEELIRSIDGISLKKLGLIKTEGFQAFWQAINGSFLLPLFLGIASGILFLSSGITYLIAYYPILLWSFFFGLIVASIFILIKQLGKRNALHYLLLLLGILIAFGITRLTPSGESTNLLYLFFSSTIAIIAMILPVFQEHFSSYFWESMKKYCKPSMVQFQFCLILNGKISKPFTPKL